mgnify:CR=1 FL=1
MLPVQLGHHYVFESNFSDMLIEHGNQQIKKVEFINMEVTHLKLINDFNHIKRHIHDWLECCG